MKVAHGIRVRNRRPPDHWKILPHFRPGATAITSAIASACASPRAYACAFVRLCTSYRDRHAGAVCVDLSTIGH